MLKRILLTMTAISTVGINSVMANNIKYDVTNTQFLNGKGFIKITTSNNINDIKQQLKNLGINIKNIDLNNCPDIIIPDNNTGSIIPDSNNQNSKPNTEQSNFTKQVVKLVNEERAKAGLSALSIDNNITSAALTRAKEIEKSFSHTRPNGSNFSSALTENNVKFLGSGENIAYGQTSPEQVMKGWMNSPGHRANILNPKFTKIGVGYYKNSKGISYWTQLFTY